VFPMISTWTGEQKAEWIELNSSFLFPTAGRSMEYGADEVVLYGEPEGHERWMPVAYGDGHVEWLDEG